jgi:hypothetical protein
MNTREQIETVLSEMRRDLAEHGDRIVIFTPYIPLHVTTWEIDPITQEHIWKTEAVYGDRFPRNAADVEKIDASPERSTKLSDVIATVRGLLRINL